MFKTEMNRFRNLMAVRRVWLGQGGKPVAKDIAQARADICIPCPKNKEMGIYEGASESVANVIREQLEVKSQDNIELPDESRLHICEVCGCVLKLLVHVPNQILIDHHDIDPKSGYPDHCWKLRL